MPSPGEVRDLRTGLRLRAAALRARAVEGRAAAIERACVRLLDAEHPAGRALRAELLRSTGLSAPVIEHGLGTTLRLFTCDAMLALRAEHRAERERTAARAPSSAGVQSAASGSALAVVVLAGNVFSAAARPLLLPLLCGSPVLLKAASADDVLPRALQRALAEVDPELGAACAVVTFGREDAALRDALIADADVLSIYGDDRTVAAFESLRSGGTRLVAHGHGLGLAFVARSALASEGLAEQNARALADDVAAYDQRGCLSPHAVLVQSGARDDGARFAQRLADALDARAHAWPRGALPPEVAAAQLQWRGVAAATGALHVRASCAVSHAGAGALRTSPGHRNVSVHDCADVDALRALIAPLSTQLKALAVAGDAERVRLAQAAPYVCAPGAMQEPPLAARLDGVHPCEGL